MDRYRFDADSHPNIHVDADPDPDSDPNWHHADPHADPTPSFTHFVKSEFFLLLANDCQLTMFYLTRQRQICHNFQYFAQHIDIF